MKRNTVQQTRLALAWLESKGLDSIEFSIEAHRYSGGVNLSINAEKITSEDLRAIKRHFGPMKADENYESKDLVGSVMLDDDHRIKCTVARVYKCTTIDPTEITEEKWDSIKEKVRDGLIKIADCEMVELNEEAA